MQNLPSAVFVPVLKPWKQPLETHFLGVSTTFPLLILEQDLLKA